MIKVTEDKLIIEIPCNNPMEDLSYLQEGLAEMIEFIDFGTYGSSAQNCMNQLAILLKATSITTDQAISIKNHFDKNKDLKKAFN